MWDTGREVPKVSRVLYKYIGELVPTESCSERDGTYNGGEIIGTILVNRGDLGRSLCAKIFIKERSVVLGCKNFYTEYVSPLETEDQPWS